MPKFSKISKERLATCHEDLQKLFNEVVKEYDCSIIEGYRDKERQKELYHQGKSKIKEGKHNKNPSLAVDVVPYPIPDRWGENNHKERAKFYHFAGYVKGIAQSMGLKIRCGCDWDSDNDFNDQRFDDLVHFELLK